MLDSFQKWIPKIATAPFCPSEVHGSIEIPQTDSFLKKLFRYIGPGLLISVGYMDPGNWATDIEAGSRYGYSLLSIVILSSLAAISLQYLSLKLGLATGKDLAQHSRAEFSKPTNFIMWILAELAIIACDLAEVLGSALAFHLLFGCSMITGILITALDTFIVLGFQGKGFRRVEAIIFGLIATIGICFFAELIFINPDWGLVSTGILPSTNIFLDHHSMYLAIGILGATVMPHNLYLHSSIAQTRNPGLTEDGKRNAIRFSSADTIISLSFALLINAAILILAATAFHYRGHTDIAEIQDAYKLLSPIVGVGAASVLFAIALLAAGQSSTFTGTIAGQVLMEGHMEFKIPCWQRRIITRGLALIPALIGVWILGENSVGKLLVLSQVCLSLQLPFAIFPLIRFTSSSKIMGSFANRKTLKIISWSLFAVITGANILLVSQIVGR